MGFLDKISAIADQEKLASMTVTDPRKVFEEILKQTSGSRHTRDISYDIFYQIIAFYGVVEGVGCSTIVANTALALADTNLSICVIDTSILNPVQDVLLKTSVAVDTDETVKSCLDWFDMPYTRESVLHVSKIKKNISVLSFKGKHRGVVDALSSSDTAALVEYAFSELHNKFDIILVDCCHELTAVNTACLQQAQQVIQIWNDTPTVVANLENFITNAITLSCPLDKMRYVIYSKMCKDAMGSLDPLVAQYRCRHLATCYVSDSISLAIVTGTSLYQKVTDDPMIIAFTECIIKIACHILNVKDNGEHQTEEMDISEQDVQEVYKNDKYRMENDMYGVVQTATDKEFNTDITGVAISENQKIEVNEGDNSEYIDDSVADAVAMEDMPVLEEKPKTFKDKLFGRKKAKVAEEVQEDYEETEENIEEENTIEYEEITTDFSEVPVDEEYVEDDYEEAEIEEEYEDVEDTEEEAEEEVVEEKSKKFGLFGRRKK